MGANYRGYNPVTGDDVWTIAGEMQIASGGQLLVESGGEIEVKSGGILDILAGAVVTIAETILSTVVKASPVASDGLLAYLDLTLEGTVSGLTRNVGIWTNLAVGAVWSGYAHFVLDVGFYHGGDDFAGDLYLLNLSYQCSALSTPGTVAMIRANCDTPQPPDYFILFENDEAGAITRSDPGTTFEAYIKVRGNEDSRDYAIPLVLL